MPATRAAISLLILVSRRLVAPLLVCAGVLGCTDERAGEVAETVIELGRSPAIELATAQEIESICVSFTLDNDEPLYVQAIDMAAGFGFHHSAWFAAPEDMFDAPAGWFDCREAGFVWQDTFVEGGGLVFGHSTQARAETQAFGPRTVVTIPPRARLVGDVHLINVTGAPLTTDIGFTLHTIDESDVATQLRALYFTMLSLEVPPGTRSRTSTYCPMNHDEPKIYYAMSHYHDYGEGLTLEAVDGDGNATTVLDTREALGEQFGEPITPAFDMTPYWGLRFSCTYFNHSTETLRYGFDEEMCGVLAFTDSDAAWLGGVVEGAVPEYRGEDADGVAQYEMPCGLVLPLWDR